MHVVVIQSCTPYNDTGGHTASSSLSNMSSVKVTRKIDISILILLIIHLQEFPFFSYLSKHNTIKRRGNRSEISTFSFCQPHTKLSHLLRNNQNAINTLTNRRLNTSVYSKEEIAQMCNPGNGLSNT